MISAKYAQAFARYNRWQNASLIAAADQLTEAQRQQPAGAFFGSILETLSHILWGDSAWMNRLTQTPFSPTPIDESGQLWNDWAAYKQARKAMDERIIEWANLVDDNFFKKRSHLHDCQRHSSHQATRFDCDAHLQSPNTSSRSGPLLADAVWRQDS